jgi:hypothetical protein
MQYTHGIQTTKDTHNNITCREYTLLKTGLTLAQTKKLKLIKTTVCVCAHVCILTHDALVHLKPLVQNYSQH